MYKLFVESCCNWMLEVFSLLLKLIVLFDCCLGELFERVYGVPEYVCVVFVIPVLIQFLFPDV
jgi:hypothetical protein